VAQHRVGGGPPQYRRHRKQGDGGAEGHWDGEMRDGATGAVGWEDGRRGDGLLRNGFGAVRTAIPVVTN